MDVDTAALLTVLQGKLHTAVQIFQTGDAGQVDSAQSQLFRPCSMPLLPTHITQIAAFLHRSLARQSVDIGQTPSFLLTTGKLTSAELQKYLVS